MCGLNCTSLFSKSVRHIERPRRLQVVTAYVLTIEVWHCWRSTNVFDSDKGSMHMHSSAFDRIDNLKHRRGHRLQRHFRHNFLVWKTTTAWWDFQVSNEGFATFALFADTNAIERVLRTTLEGKKGIVVVKDVQERLRDNIFVIDAQ